MVFSNSYNDETRAAAYDKLEFAGTYHLAFRDLPHTISAYVTGKQALDFGCGTGRSTRFLKNLGFTTMGIDISPEMIAKAKKRDPSGTYLCITDGDFHQLSANSYDLILSAFTFDNIPTTARKTELFKGLAEMLAEDGVFINIVSSPELYTHEWASFSTRDFPQNNRAKTGDVVSVVTTDFSDRRPCLDILCTEGDYKTILTNAGLYIMSIQRPLAKGDEPYQWVNETKIAPWIIYILSKNKANIRGND